MKKQAKLTTLLPKLLSGDSSAKESVEKILFEHFVQFSENLKPPERKRQVTYITHVLRESIPLHELKLNDKERAHLMAIAAKKIRQVILDINRKGQKNNSIGALNTEIFDKQSPQPNANQETAQSIDFITVDKCLQELAEMDQQKAQLFEMSYFGGMNYEEMSEIVSITVAAVDRELRFARAWLCKQLSST